MWKFVSDNVDFCMEMDGLDMVVSYTTGHECGHEWQARKYFTHAHTTMGPLKSVWDVITRALS